jgi:hypothetical protein
LFTWVKKGSIGGDYGVNSIMRIHTIDISSWRRQEAEESNAGEKKRDRSTRKCNQAYINIYVVYTSDHPTGNIFTERKASAAGHSITLQYTLSTAPGVIFTIKTGEARYIHIYISLQDMQKLLCLLRHQPIVGRHDPERSRHSSRVVAFWICTYLFTIIRWSEFHRPRRVYWCITKLNKASEGKGVHLAPTLHHVVVVLGSIWLWRMDCRSFGRFRPAVTSTDILFELKGLVSRDLDKISHGSMQQLVLLLVVSLRNY